MSQTKYAVEQMEYLFLNGAGDVKKAAEVGIEIIKTFMHLPLIEKEAYQLCFDKISKEVFYHHVIQQARYCWERYSK